MKKLLIILFILPFFTSAQNYYVLGIDTANGGRPGYKYLQRPLYLVNPLSRLNDSTVQLGTVTVPFGGTGLTSLTAYALLAGGTTSTGNIQQVSNAGAAAGQVLTYVSSSALPTWQTVSGSGLSGGTATRVAFWKSATALSSGANINIDSANTRIGFGTSSPTHTIVLDSATSAAAASGTSSTGTGGIIMKYTTDATGRRGHIYASGNGMSIMANEYSSGGATFFPLVLNHISTYVASNGVINCTGVVSSGNISTTGPADIFSANYVRASKFTAAANNNAMQFDIVTQNQSSGMAHGLYINGTANQLQTGSAGFNVLLMSYNASGGSGKYSFLNLGGFSGSNHVSKWRVFTNAHTVINDSTDNGYMLDVNGTTRMNGGTSYKYVAKTGAYTATSTDHTIDCTSGTFTVTLPTSVGIAGTEYVITNSGSGTITIATTSSQTFTNITSTPTTLTLSPVGSGAIVSYRLEATGSAWIVTGKVKNE